MADSTISNLSSIMSKYIGKMSNIEVNRYGSMQQAIENTSGWRHLGMYVTGGYGEASVDFAITGQGGNTVG